MKKRILIVLLLLLPVSLGVIIWGRDTNWSYVYKGIDDYALKHRKWKSVQGDALGDFLFFRSDRWPDSDITVDEKYNIYLKGVKSGRVINATSERLTVETLNGHRGYYIYF